MTDCVALRLEAGGDEQHDRARAGAGWARGAIC